MAKIEIRLCDEDREVYKGPEWMTLDVDALFDTRAVVLERWETETGYAIERAVGECAAPGGPSAKAVRVLVWLARKQHGANAGVFSDDGEPERFARLADMKTMKVRMRDAAPEPEDDVDPPAEPPGTPHEP